MNMRAVRRVSDWICKPFSLPDNLCRTSELTKVPEQISPPIVRLGWMGNKSAQDSGSVSPALDWRGR